MFEANGTIEVKDVPGFGRVTVPCCRISFKSWTGERPFDFGGKPFLEHDGQPVFAELLIQRVLSQGDWQAVWVVSWAGGRYFVRRPIGSSRIADYADDLESVPLHVRQTIERIVALARTKANGKGSAPDIVAWNTEGVIRFLEAKRRGKDSPNDNQKRFIAAMLELGFPLAMFTFVEWTAV